MVVVDLFMNRFCVEVSMNGLVDRRACELMDGRMCRLTDGFAVFEVGSVVV